MTKQTLFGLSLLALLTVGASADEAINQRGTAPGTWAGSQGVKQPTGFEVRGYKDYQLRGSQVTQIPVANSPRNREFWRAQELNAGGSNSAPANKE